MDYTVPQLKAIIAEAMEAAREAGSKYYTEDMGGDDSFPCGFAWVNIFGIKGNTAMGRALKAAGVKQDYNRVFSIWNPSGLPIQNVYAKEVGADAAARVFKKYGFDSYSGSRWD